MKPPRKEVAILRALVKAQWRVIDALYSGRDSARAERAADRLADELEDRHEWDRAEKMGRGIDAVLLARAQRATVRR